MQQGSFGWKGETAVWVKMCVILPQHQTLQKTQVHVSGTQPKTTCQSASSCTSKKTRREEHKQACVVQDDSTSARPQVKKKQPKYVLDKLFDSDSEHSTEDDNDRTDVFQWTFCSNEAEATEMMRGECCVVSHSGYSGKAVLVCPCNVNSVRTPLFSCSEQCYKEKSEPDCRTCRHADTPAVSSLTCPHRNTLPEGPKERIWFKLHSFCHSWTVNWVWVNVFYFAQILCWTTTDRSRFCILLMM